MDDNTKRMFLFAAVPTAAIAILACLLRALTGSAMADLVFWAVLTAGGAGGLIGFISGRSSNAMENNLARVPRTVGSRKRS